MRLLKRPEPPSRRPQAWLSLWRNRLVGGSSESEHEERKRGVLARQARGTREAPLRLTGCQRHCLREGCAVGSPTHDRRPCQPSAAASPDVLQPPAAIRARRAAASSGAPGSSSTSRAASASASHGGGSPSHRGHDPDAAGRPDRRAGRRGSRVAGGSSQYSPTLVGTEDSNPGPKASGSLKSAWRVSRGLASPPPARARSCRFGTVMPMFVAWS